jgi:hypothetical protein
VAWAAVDGQPPRRPAPPVFNHRVASRHSLPGEDAALIVFAKQQGRRAHLRPKGAPFPHSPMLGLTMRFAAIRRVRRGAMIVPPRNLSANAMPPLGQYFSRLLVKSQMCPLRPPKGTDPRTLRLFPCKPAVFRGPPEGAMIAFFDPEPAAPVLVGEGHAPVVAVLPGMSKRSVPSQSCLCQAISRGSPLRDSECPAR